jgi:hypothetical protein
MKKILFILIFINLSLISYAECYSDFDCGIGYKCVKSMYSVSGICMRSVDEFGTPKYNMPSTDSIYPKTKAGCTFDTDCPIGFRCDSYYNECVRR